MRKTLKTPVGKTRAKTLTVIDWSSLKVGVKYVFSHKQDFDDFRNIKTRAHNGARRRNLKAKTRRDVENGRFEVIFTKQ